MGGKESIKILNLSTSDPLHVEKKSAKKPSEEFEFPNSPTSFIASFRGK